MTDRRRGRAGRALVAAALGLVVATTGAVGVGDGVREAWAQSTPDVTLRVDAPEVEVGEPVSLTLSAMSDSSTPQPSDPQLKPPRGWTASAPMVSTQSQMSIVNGQVSQRSGFRATWQAVASAPGTYELGPVSYSLGGKRMLAGGVKVVVKPASPGGPKPRQRQRVDPFGGLFGQLFGMDDPRPIVPDSLPQTNQLALPEALEPQAFLRAVIDKTQAVVGEQVTLTIYLYRVPRSSQVIDPHESTSPDFFQRIVSSGDEDVQSVNVGGTRWVVQMLRKVALFPLKAGDLEVGPMSLTMLGQGFRGSGARGGLVRSSQPLTVHVTEPPPGPRPAGYTMGDVGSFNLQAQVEPRRVEAGGSIAVTAVLRGTGNPPASLRLPERKGVTWLEPEVRESVEPTSDGTINGARSFTYIVKMSDAGTVDLGNLAVSFWNPKLHEYQTARAALGVVEVTPGANGATSAPAASGSATPGAADPFAVVGPVRTTPGAYTLAATPLSDRPWFWGLLLAAPALVLAGQGASGAVGGWRRRKQQHDEAASTRARKALAEAREAEDRGDRRGAAAALERAVVAAVEGATGVRVRALLASEIGPRLRDAGLDESEAAAVASLLSDCEHQRFLPGEAAATHELSDRAATLLRRLGS